MLESTSKYVIEIGKQRKLVLCWNIFDVAQTLMCRLGTTAVLEVFIYLLSSFHHIKRLYGILCENKPIKTLQTLIYTWACMPLHNRM